ncbi:hypothetical protein HDV06_001264 [Boothiomyces sp. JEL0866]|nr:hypothetical protein HDV06_001264 [Boothiomyces sp. JEL0866]
MKYSYVASLVMATAAQNTNYLSTVPVARDGYHPLPQIQASYQLPKPDNSMIIAGMQFTPTFPTVNLGNFPGIQISCQNDAIKLQFQDANSASQAMNTWTAVNNLHFLINHEVQCHDVDETTAYQVGNLSLNDSQISVKFTPAQLHEVIDEYELNIAHVQQDANKRSTTSKNLPISINFANGQAANPDISIFKNDAVSLSCENCFANGNVNFQITASGTRLSLKDYKFDINGNMFATMDLDAKVLAADNHFLKQVNLFTKSLDPIAVKGIFNFGPAIALDAGVSYSVTEDIDFTYGFEFNYDFGFTAVAHQKPTFTQTPKFKQHPLKISKDIQVSVSAHLIPSIQMNLEVLKAFTLDASLPVDTSLGLEFDTGKFNTCPTGNFGVALISQTDLSFNIHGESIIKIFKPFNENFDIFNTGKLTLATFCEKPKSPLATTTVNKIDVKPTTTTNPVVIATTTNVVTTSQAAAATTTTQVAGTITTSADIPETKTSQTTLSTQSGTTTQQSSQTTSAPETTSANLQTTQQSSQTTPVIVQTTQDSNYIPTVATTPTTADATSTLDLPKTQSSMKYGQTPISPASTTENIVIQVTTTPVAVSDIPKVTANPTKGDTATTQGAQYIPSNNQNDLSKNKIFDTTGSNNGGIDQPKSNGNNFIGYQASDAPASNQDLAKQDSPQNILSSASPFSLSISFLFVFFI